jgi:hypothetical protein
MSANSASDPATEKSKTRKQPCSITGKEYARRDLVQLDALRPSLADRIRQDHPELAFDAFISKVELAQYRTKYVEELLKAEHGDYAGAGSTVDAIKLCWGFELQANESCPHRTTRRAGSSEIRRYAGSRGRIRRGRG